METNSVGAYSPETVYGQLTSPFVPKTITVNVTTPYDVVDENATAQEVFSRSYFKGNPYPKMKFEIGKDEEEKTSPLTVKQTPNDKTNINQIGQFEERTNSLFNKQEIASFSVSKLSSKDIVNSSLKLGYTAEEAVVIDNARKAYEKSLLITENPAETLSSCSYRVK